MNEYGFYYNALCKGTLEGVLIPYYAEGFRQRAIKENAKSVRQLMLILVIEDNEDIRQSLKHILEFEGYEVTEASNGKEALKILFGSSRLPFLILLDLMMPVMNGWDFMKVKKETRYLAPIPLIVLSADCEREISTGIIKYLKKPINLNILFKAIGEFSKIQPTIAKDAAA